MTSKPGSCVHRVQHANGCRVTARKQWDTGWSYISGSCCFRCSSCSSEKLRSKGVSAFGRRLHAITRSIPKAMHIRTHNFFCTYTHALHTCDTLFFFPCAPHGVQGFDTLRHRTSYISISFFCFVLPNASTRTRSLLHTHTQCSFFFMNEAFLWGPHSLVDHFCMGAQFCFFAYRRSAGY